MLPVLPEFRCSLGVSVVFWESGCSLRGGGFLGIVSLRRIFVYLFFEVVGYPCVRPLSDAIAKVIHWWAVSKSLFAGIEVFGRY